MVVRKDIGNSIQASEGDHSYNISYTKEYVGRLSSHVVLCPSTYYIVVPLSGRSYTLYPVPIIPVFNLFETPSIKNGEMRYVSILRLFHSVGQCNINLLIALRRGLWTTPGLQPPLQKKNICLNIAAGSSLFSSNTGSICLIQIPLPSHIGLL